MIFGLTNATSRVRLICLTLLLTSSCQRSPCPSKWKEDAQEDRCVPATTEVSAPTRPDDESDGDNTPARTEPDADRSRDGERSDDAGTFAYDIDASLPSMDATTRDQSPDDVETFDGASVPPPACEASDGGRVRCAPRPCCSQIVIAGPLDAGAIQLGWMDDGGFRSQTILSGWFSELVSQPFARPLVGDFNNDGRSDLAVTGIADVSTLAVAFAANTSGAYDTTNRSIGKFAAWTLHEGNKPLAGDYNGDGLTDIALVGAIEAWTVAIAFSQGDGTFAVTNEENPEFSDWANDLGTQAMVGDFDGDGRDDLALVGGDEAWTLPVARSLGGGSFDVSNLDANEFAAVAKLPSVRPIAGDYDADGRSDIALVGLPGSSQIMVAFSLGDGSFRVVSEACQGLGAWAAAAKVQPVGGDFDADGRSDIAFVGAPDSPRTIPIAYARVDGSFTVIMHEAGDFTQFAREDGVTVLGGY
jgi:hypothetical protein